MKKIFKFLAFALIAVVIIFILGPRPDTSFQFTFDPSKLGDNLDIYLQESESKIPNIRDGAQKEIIWADPTSKSKTHVSFVYIHGFSATKHETRPLTDRIAETLEANVFYTRLQGHGRDGDAMAEATLQGWVNDFAEAVAIGERLGEKVVIITASTGSSIATLGLTNPELAKNVAGVVMISPNYETHGIATWLANIPWAETILPAVAGSSRSWEPVNEEHGKWWTTSYPTRAIFPMTALLKVLKGIDKSSIKTPAYFIYSPDDRVIVAQEAASVAYEWGGLVKITTIDESEDPFNHVLAGDILSPGNTDKIVYDILAWLIQNKKLNLPEVYRGAGNQL